MTAFINRLVNRLIARALGTPWLRGWVERVLWFPRRFEYKVTPTFVKVGKNAPSNTCLLQFGDRPGVRPGVFFEAKVWLRSRRHSGHVQFVQDIVMDRKRTTFQGRDECLTTNGVRMLDQTDPYYEEQVAGTGPHRVLNEDSPVNSLMGAEILEIKEQFRMFLMWRPARFGGRFRAPIAKIEWSWQGKAMSHNPNGGPDCRETALNGVEFGWKLVSQPNEHVEGAATPTTELPVTSPNVAAVIAAGYQVC